jgi:glycerol-3-phosphate cytidylyltransferase-like family protein
MKKKREYILNYKADILVMGDDWAGKFDSFSDIFQVVYLPRTNGVSTTELLDGIAHANRASAC